jgi:hypothetical protein
MAEYTRSRRMSASADQLFDFLGRIEAMPSYIPSMTKAERTDVPGEVRVAADVQGRTVEGTARIAIDHDGRRVTWSSEGDNDYHGWVLVRGDDQTAEAEVHISTERAADEGMIDQGLEQTLDRIAELVEQGVA